MGGELDSRDGRNVMAGFNGLLFCETARGAPAKLPVLFLSLMFMRRTIGVGAFAPFRAISKAMWICIRLFFDYMTDTDGGFDIWFWIFCLSLTWPIWNIIRGWWTTVVESPRISVRSTAMSGRSFIPSSQSNHGSRSQSPSSRASTPSQSAPRAPPL